MVYLMFVVSENRRKDVSKLPVPFCACTRASVLFFNSDETTDLVSRSQAEHFSEDDALKRPFSVSGYPALLQFLSALLQTGKSIMAPALQDQIRRSIRAERDAAPTAPTDTLRGSFSVSYSQGPRAGPACPGRPAGCDRGGAPSGFKCVTERAGTGTERRRLLPVPFLSFQEFPRRWLPACSGGGSPEHICHASTARVPVRVAQSRGALLGNSGGASL